MNGSTFSAYGPFLFASICHPNHTHTAGWFDHSFFQPSHLIAVATGAQAAGLYRFALPTTTSFHQSRLLHRGAVMANTRDFAAEPLGQNVSDAQPPDYIEVQEGLPEYDHPPSYLSSIPYKNGAIWLSKRCYRDVSLVQLTPLEVAILRQHLSVFVWILVPKALERGEGLRSKMKRLMKPWKAVRVKNEDIDDYGRWKGPVPVVK